MKVGEKNNIRLSFRDVPLVAREKALKSELVRKELLKKLPIAMRELFIDGFLNPTQEKLDALRDFFADPKVSIITHYIITHKPSSHKALEPLYDKTPEMLVDRYFFNCPAGDAISDRLEAVINEVPLWITRIKKNKDKVRVLVPGSGSGQDVVGMLIRYPYLKDKVDFYCVDNEPSALELGEYLANKNKVKQYIHYLEGDMMKLDYREMDLALLVGIICPLGHLTGINVIKKVAEYCRDGYLIVSAAQQKMLFEDPVTCFVMDFIRWKLFYRTHDQVKETVEKAGLLWQDHFYDPQRQYHEMAISRIPIISY